MTIMAAIDRFLPCPQLHDVDYVDVGAPRSRTWEAMRHLDFGRSPVVRALFALRTVPDRLHDRQVVDSSWGIDDITANKSGFQILDELTETSITVGAIGKVWKPEIEFAPIPTDRFAAFDQPGWIKVAWELRCEPRGEAVTRVSVDLRVTATDPDSWRRFRKYFLLVGPFSHFIRRHLLALLVRELGGPSEAEQKQRLPGDELLPDASDQVTYGVTIAARPESIWPWLVQMGCGRAGWYSWDILDNAGVPSAREIIPELQSLQVGDVVPWAPKSSDGFEVLQLNPPTSIVLGAFVDVETGHQVRFGAQRPAHYFQDTWAFVLEPINGATRLHVRNRTASSREGFSSRALMRAMPLIHHFMETAQLRHLRDRVEAAEARAAKTAHP